MLFPTWSKATLACAAYALGTLVACRGPDPEEPDAGTSTGAPSTTEAATAVTTGPAEPCSEVYEGNLAVRDSVNFGALVNVGRVTGDVYIGIRKGEQRDLSFLACLHTIDGVLSIGLNETLESTEGLANLENVTAIYIHDNPGLRAVTGFDRLRSTMAIDFSNNPMVETLEFAALESVTWISIGFCMNTTAFANTFALTELSGFNALTSIGYFWIDGNEALTSLGILDALAVNGGPPPGHATIRLNPLLPEAGVHAQLDALGVQSREVCGNAGGSPDCFCIVGE